MLEFTFLGTCSGTEPMPNRHHSSFVIKINGFYYLFDAGENCAYRAHTMGIDVSRIRAVFISHMHVDHVGGLANVISAINKISNVTKKPHVNGNSYDIFVPDLVKLDAIKMIAEWHRAPTYAGVRAIGHEYYDGVVYEDENIKVTAYHNTHLREDGSCGWHSYSFVIEAEGKKTVFSGDVGATSDLDPLTLGGCDLLIMETGHHTVKSVLEYAIACKAKKLLFTHHGREILKDVDAARKYIAEYALDARILDDGDQIIL